MTEDQKELAESTSSLKDPCCNAFWCLEHNFVLLTCSKNYSGLYYRNLHHSAPRFSVLVSTVQYEPLHNTAALSQLLCQSLVKMCLSQYLMSSLELKLVFHITYLDSDVNHLSAKFLS